MDVGRSHILVVDDWADAGDSTAELLIIWGYDARACDTGAAALESARAHRPDAVLLDLAMPHMDGFQFAALFRELPRCGAVPIIAVTGYARAVHGCRAREVGIRHYLLKPADPARLKEVLASEVAPPTRVPVFDLAHQPRELRPTAGESIPGRIGAVTSSLAKGG
jgi:CheY-like chemotaxis protein